MTTHHPSRRQFLSRSLGIAAALTLPRALWADPLAPWLSAPPRLVRPVRVRGRVLAAGRGIGNAGISDGIEVVSTAADGSFELVSDGRRPWVTVTPPSGYAIPTQPNGTFRCFSRVTPDARGEASVRFDLQPLGHADERHGFLVLADTQTQDREEMARLHAETVPDVRSTIQGLGDLPLFGVADGDIMYDHLELYGDYERGVTAMGIPFAQVVGNHDLDLNADSDEASTATFEQHFGPRYYSFNRGRVHYVILDDVFYYDGGYLGYLPQDQLTWLANDLAMVERGATVVVFLHIPLLSTGFERAGNPKPPINSSVANRDALVRLLEPYRARVISGHVHEMEHRMEGSVVEHIAAAVCGAWWTGDICYDGSPNGYVVYEVNGDDLRWRYKGTGLPADRQVRVYGGGSDPRAPGEIVANVWDWNDRWTVTWYENGERKGRMSRRIGLDPRSVRLHTGPDLPKKRGWVEPVPTGHLFYAPVSADAKQVMVEARDPWGRTYTATPETA